MKDKIIIVPIVVNILKSVKWKHTIKNVGLTAVIRK